LQTRSRYNFSKNDQSKFGVYLAYSNEEVAKHNYSKLIKLEKPVFVIEGKHNNKRTSKISCNEFGGLGSTLYLSEGVRVVLTRNLWIQKGLCNGSMGYVKHIIYKEGIQPVNLPIAVIVEFDGYTGPSFINNRCVPIVPVLSEVDGPSGQFERIQIPLRLCYAITIHKSRGLTLDSAIVNVGKSEIAGCRSIICSFISNKKTK